MTSRAETGHHLTQAEVAVALARREGAGRRATEAAKKHATPREPQTLGSQRRGERSRLATLPSRAEWEADRGRTDGCFHEGGLAHPQAASAAHPFSGVRPVRSSHPFSSGTSVSKCPRHLPWSFPRVALSTVVPRERRRIGQNGPMDCYLFSRRDWPELATLDPVSLATHVFFQMWKTRSFPYNCLSEGDVIYIGDTETRYINWEVRVRNLLRDFGYSSPRHALSALRSAYGLYAADLNDYHRDRSGMGWLLAWTPEVMRKMRIELPPGCHFGRNGYRPLTKEERAAIGLPAPKTSRPLATPPPWYDVVPGRTGQKRKVPRYIPLLVRQRVAERDRYQCVGCRAKTNLHFDHIVPHSRGGESTVENLRIVCAGSNLARGAGEAGVPLHCARVAR